MRKRKGRPVSGIVVLDKPLGMTSNRLLQRVKRMYNAQKAGHTGSLDPLATGVLPICLGEATKISQFLLDADKAYLFTVKFGEVTATGDAEGEVIHTAPVSAYDEEKLEDICSTLTGEIEQVPPLYSAIHVAGKRLYEYARQGQAVEIPTRRVVIRSLVLESYNAESATFKVHCSKGTYVRSLAVSIGERLQCGGHVTMLRRTCAGRYSLSCAISIELLESSLIEQGVKALDDMLLPIEGALEDWPHVILDDREEREIGYGRPVIVMDGPVDSKVVMMTRQGACLGIGWVDLLGNLQPKRVFNLDS